MKLIAQGAYAKIYKVDNTVIKINKHEGDILGNRHLVECDITRRIRHPNLIKAIGLDDKCHLIFPYYRYDLSCQEVLSLSYERKKYLGLQLLDGIRALHGQGFLHLDIKGNNIFVDESLNNLVIGDFGSALYIGADASISVERDLIIYENRSPEHIVDNASGCKVSVYRKANDYWALGLLCLNFFASKIRIFDTVNGRHTTTLFNLQNFFGHRDLTLETMKTFVPHLEPFWIETITGLLRWIYKDRKIFSSRNTEAHSLRLDSITLSIEDKAFLKHEFSRLKNNLLDYPFEAIIIALEIYKKVRGFIPRTSSLLVTCLWMSVKFTTGLLIDPRDIDHELEEPDGVLRICDLEFLVIKQIEGVIYTKTSWMKSKNINDLKTAWYEVWSSTYDYNELIQTSGFVWQKKIKIGQMLDYLSG